MKFVNGIPGDSVIYTLTMACHIANHEYKKVLLEINDMMILVDERTSLDDLWKKYQDKLNFKFEIQRLKQEMQK